jgi:hypothetical protein
MRPTAALVLFAAAATAADPGPPEFEAKLADDSTLKVVLLDPTVTVATRYGKLVLPAADIRKVEFGFRYPPGVEAKAEAAAADLAAPAFKAREEAEKTLLGLGEYAAPAVRRARKNTDAEAAKRADAVWRKLAEKVVPEKLDARDYDLIEADFPVRGRIEPTTLKVRSKYFGESELKLSEVRGLRSLASLGGPVAVALDAAKYGRSGWGAWFDTGLDVTTDAPLDMACGGQIRLHPQQPAATVGPAGLPNTALGEPIPKVVVNGPFGRQVVGGQQFPPGAVVGRIGAEGTPFLVGAGYSAPRAPATGRLLLAVAPWQAGVDPAGEFQVRIKVGN